MPCFTVIMPEFEARFHMLITKSIAHGLRQLQRNTVKKLGGQMKGFNQN